MKRAMVLLVMILSLVAFASGSVSVGADPDTGRLASAKCSLVLTGSQPDSSRMPTSCVSPCVLCGTALIAMENWLAASGDRRADCPLALVNQGVTETLYRPPKPR